jgi:DNA-binding LytR/AlgR family response regulator
MNISALIIDDEQLARDELKYLLDQVGGVEVVAQGANGIEAVDLIEEYRPDLVFLDVQMPGLDGFAAIQRLIERNRQRTPSDKAAEPLPQIVFATAYDQYAVRAFDVNAVDYLLKPFDQTRVQQAVDRVRSRMAGGASGASITAKDPGRVSARRIIAAAQPPSGSFARPSTCEADCPGAESPALDRPGRHLLRRHRRGRDSRGHADL